MKIQLTQDEYKRLLDMVEIARWVMFTHPGEEGPDREPYKDLCHKLLSCAKMFQLENQVLFDEESEVYQRKSEFNDAVETYIEEFEVQNFFSQLADQLTTRDLVAQEGLEKLRNMAPEERYEKYESTHNTYLDEFEENGIENLQVKPSS